MSKTDIFFPIFCVIFFNSCGSTTVKDERSVTLSVNAGSDKIAKINSTVTIEGVGTTSDGTQLSYVWKKNSEILATSAVFQYVPTVLGTDTLELFVQHKSGEVISDTMKVSVIKTPLHSKIPIISSSVIQDYLLVINKARLKTQECGEKGRFPATTALTWSDKLYKSSYEHSYDLAYSEIFSHAGSGTKSDWTGYAMDKKSTLSERIEVYDYSWSFIGENIGAGTVMDSPEKMVDGWLASDGHCANLMNPNFKEVGMAMVKKDDTHYIHYWTQDFGTQR